MRVIASTCLLFIGVSKILQGKIYAPYLWIELKATNNTLQGALTGSFFMFQYPLALMMFVPMIIIRFISCVVPNPEAYDFTWRKYFVDLAWTVVWLALTFTFFILLFFGSTIDQTGYNQEQIQQSVLDVIQSSILDYECVGSRLWLIISCFYVPSLLIGVKILTN